MTPQEKIAFKREVDAMKKFESPFIVKLLEAFEQNDHFYLATKYADGGSLDSHLKTYHNKKLPIDEAVRFFTMICLGLNYIHI
jgi:serine/threonine protein kinase